MLHIQLSSQIFLFTTLLLILASILMSKKNSVELEKNSQFECGFEPAKFENLPLSLRFFTITIVFLIFDVEIAILLPMIKSISSSPNVLWLVLNLMFLLILISGTFLEWKLNSFEWK